MDNPTQAALAALPASAAPVADQAASAALELSSVERAAIVLLSMGEEPAAHVLRCLSREELLDVTLAMSRMNGVKVNAVQKTIHQFFDSFRAQSSVRGASRSFLQRSLDIALGGVIANRVLNRIYGDVIGPKMARLQWAQPQWLADRLAREHVRMQAMFLVFLPPEQASQVIYALPEASRERVLLNIARLKEIDYDLLRDLEAVVDLCLDNLGTQSTAVEGTRQLAQIINRMPGGQMELVEMLRAHDPDLIAEVEEQIYDFEILARQNDATIAIILDQVDSELWGVALKGAAPALPAALMRAMPRRSVMAFEEMLRRSPPVPMSRVEQARREVMERVKELAENGEVELQLVAEEVV
ncbi:FliG C-terminal domain-containing protein [Paraburkholderia bonniea]|uniref:FliG C-terminal domain-containing protein n=1 Tax=Paraburkholderia bonniea TaxID=2152891 RepID=UPI002572FAD4|nr:FliG C-terminal domain-containing protein [Paraburkholderia bonniea]WJF90773.1 FliG C-terminal domain-containing protein [Paraburkholderia bonniea]WJF94087.1 FliG C-terminal domain-containing protein [Paraburkholderia bonniea]